MSPALLKKLIVLLIFFIASALTAADPLSYADDVIHTALLDYFPIIVFAETGATANIFQFISGVAQEFAVGGDLWAIGVLAMGVPISIGIYRGAIKQSIGLGVKDLVFTVAMAGLLLAPSVSVSIFDGRTGTSTGVRVVDEVPYFVAATASVSSVFTARLMNIVDSASANIGSNSDFNFGAQGLGAPEVFALKAIQQAKLDSNTSIAVGRITAECLIPNSIDNTFFDYIGDFVDGGNHFSSFGAVRSIADNQYMLNTTMKDNQNCSTYMKTQFSQTVEDAENNVTSKILNNLNFLEQEKMAVLASQYLGLTDVKGFDKNTTAVLTDFTGYLKNYAFNGVLAGAIENEQAKIYSGGGNQAMIAAEVTAAASKGNLQVSGLGSWRAAAELVPLAHNYLLTIIYGASILMAFVILASGFDKGMAILKEYAIGLATFEFIKVAFALANNSVLFYAQDNAVGTLAGANPASIMNIAEHLEYIANMAGMAGALGLAAMLMIPGIVFGGKVASAMGVLGNVGGMIQNKGTQGAIDAIGQEKGRQKDLQSIGENQWMQQQLKAAGIHVGANSDVGSVYADYQNSMDKSAKNLGETSMYGNYNERYGAVQSQAIGSAAGLVGAGRAAQGYGMETIANAGTATGASSFSGQVAGGLGLIDAEASDSKGYLSESYKHGQKVQAQSSAASTMGVGKESEHYTNEQINQNSMATGASGFSGQMAQGEGLIDAGAIDESGGVSELYHKGQRFASHKQASSLIGSGEESDKYTNEKISGMGKSQGSKSVGSDMQTYKADKAVDPKTKQSLIGNDDMLTDEAKKGMYTNALSSAGSIIGAGQTNKLDSDIFNGGRGNSMDAMKSSTEKGIKIVDKFGDDKGGFTKGSKNDTKKEEDELSGDIDSHHKLEKAHLAKARTITEQAKHTKNKKQRSALLDKADDERDAAKDENKQGTESKSALSKLKSQPRSMTHDQMVSAEAEKGMESRFGSGLGMMTNIAKSPMMYQMNAMASEMSQAQSAFAAINTKGGVIKSVDTDVASAVVGAAESQSALKSKLRTLGGKGKTLEGMATSAEPTLRDISGTAARKQADEAIGSTKGIKHELKKRGDNGFQNVAQSGVESQTESGLGAIRGAGGIHSLAGQANSMAAVQSSVTGKMLKRFHESGLIMAGFAGQAASTQGTLSSVAKVGLENYIDTAAYDAEQKANDSNNQRKADIVGGIAKDTAIDEKTGKVVKTLTHVNDKGDIGSEVRAAQGSAKKIKDYKEQEKLEEGNAAIIKQGDDGGAGKAGEAVRKKQLIDSGQMNSDGKVGIKEVLAATLASESKLEKKDRELYNPNTGKVTSYTVNSQIAPDGKGDYSVKASLAHSSSVTKNESGNIVDRNIENSAKAEAYEVADQLMGQEATNGLLTAGIVTAGVVTSAAVANKYTKGLISVGKASDNKTDVYAVAKDGIFGGQGGYAVKQGSGYVRAEKDGTVLVNEKGNPQAVTEKELRGGAMSTLEKTKNALRRSTAGDAVFKSEKDSLNGTNDGSTNKESNHADDTTSYKSKQDTPPKESSAGLNPSSTHNSITYPNTPQGNLAKAQQNLQDIKTMAPAEFAKGNMAMMVGEQKAAISSAHEAGKIPDSEFNSKMVALTQVESKIASGAQITPSELKSAGIGNTDLAKSGFVTEIKTTPSGKTFQSVDMEASGEHQKVTATNNAQRGVTTARDGVASGKQTPNKSHATPLEAKRQGLIDGQKGNSPTLTNADYKEQLAAVDGEIAEQKTASVKTARRESNSMFGGMREHIAEGMKKTGKSLDHGGTAGKTLGGIFLGGASAMTLFGGSDVEASTINSVKQPVAQKAVTPKNDSVAHAGGNTQKVLEEGATASTKAAAITAIASMTKNPLGQVAKKALAPVAIAAATIDTASDANKRLEKGDKTGAALEVVQGGMIGAGGWAGASAGASIGASIGATVGSVVPIAGTAAGAAVGGVVGGIVGAIAGSMAGEKVGQIALDAHDKPSTAKQALIQAKPQTAGVSAQPHSVTPASNGDATARTTTSGKGNAQTVQSAPAQAQTIAANQSSQSAIATQETQTAAPVTSLATNTADKNNFMSSASAERGIRNDATKPNMGISTLSEASQAKVSSQADKDTTAMMQMMSGSPTGSSMSAIVGETTLPSKADIIGGMKQSAEVEMPVKVNPKPTIGNMGDIATPSASVTTTQSGSAEKPMSPASQAPIAPSQSGVIPAPATSIGHQAQTQLQNITQASSIDGNIPVLNVAQANMPQTQSPIGVARETTAQIPSTTQHATEASWRESGGGQIHTSQSADGRYSAPMQRMSDVNASHIPSYANPVIGEQQRQSHESHQAFMENVQQTGTYPLMKTAMDSHPVHPVMQSTPEQRRSQESFHQSLSNQGNGVSSGSVALTALDIQQTHQTRQLAQSQSDYTREISRGMDEMVTSMSNLGDYFGDFFDKMSGKTNDKA